MKRLLFTTVIAFSFFIGFSQNPLLKKGIKFQPPVCYGSDEVHQTYVEPPAQYLNRLKSTGTKTAQIIVYYDNEFEADANAKKAFQAAVDIWEYLIESPVPIRMYAFWDELDSGVLGSCGPYDWYENFENAPQKNTYYPVALVEKMMGEEVNESDAPDLVATFNKNNSNWYFGIENTTPSTKYNFTSVVLHEIGHGLGYTGMANVQNETIGYFGQTNSFPGIFDKHLKNYSNKFLADTSIFKNYSAELLKEFTSGLLFFESPIAFKDAGEIGTPRLYAPSKWDDGSSVYHLNESTYKAGDINSLMTPSFSKGETNLNPGPMTLGMLYEMGWKFIRIKHQDHPDIEKLEDLKTLEIFVKSDYTLDSTKLFLVTSSNGFVDADSVLLTKTETLTKFVANLPLTQEGTVEYYISAKDERNRIFRFPGTAPEKRYSVTLGPDNTAPSIKHTPISFMRFDKLSTDLIVETKDNIGIKSVKVEYFTNKNSPSQMDLEYDKNDTYKGILQFGTGALVDGDSVQYRIIIEDSSSANNKRISPTVGYHKFFIDGYRNPVKEYSNNFDTPTNDFITNDFSINTPANFDNGTFNSIHPYESTGQNEVYYQYTAELKYPIILKNGGIIEYDEVVLVEPGEPGVVFGGEKFWDFVIVEGSIDNGKNWLPLIDGYDSGANESWKTAYNEGLSGKNSATVGKKELFVNRRFALNNKGLFKTGDTIYLRFRLESDAGAYGWGWCIDNLKIQDPLTSLASAIFSPGELIFYPNPVNDLLVFHGSFSTNTDHVKLSLYNNLGQLVIEKDLDVIGNMITENIDMKNFKPGLYFVSVDFENGQKISRKIVKR